ncbi:MAG TPA: hypothetical protein VF345_09820 [Chthoniobacterales bacterium]
MNLKVANLVAVQFGVFVGIMSWLAYSRLEPVQPPRIAAETSGRPVNSVRPSAPVVAPRSQRPHTVDYRTDRPKARPVDAEPVLTAHDYDQEIAPDPDVTSAPDEGSFVGAAPTYSQVEQEPAVASPEYVPSPQTVAYSQPTEPAEYVQPAQLVVYSQPQLVVFSNAGSFGRRCRSMPHPGAPMPIAQQHPKRGESHLKTCGILPRPNTSVPTCRPTQDFKPRGKR